MIQFNKSKFIVANLVMQIRNLSHTDSCVRSVHGRLSLAVSQCYSITKSEAFYCPTITSLRTTVATNVQFT